jgi:hypothetical protein
VYWCKQYAQMRRTWAWPRSWIGLPARIWPRLSLVFPHCESFRGKRKDILKAQKEALKSRLEVIDKELENLRQTEKALEITLAQIVKEPTQRIKRRVGSRLSNNPSNASSEGWVIFAGMKKAI